MKTTKISWCHSTGSPWFGCTEVSEGCGHCYARVLTENRLAPLVRAAYKKAGLTDWQTRAVWGRNAPRVLTKGFYTDMLALNKKPWVCDSCQTAHAVNQGPCQHITDRTGTPCGGMTFTRRRVFPSLMDWLDNYPAGVLDQDGTFLRTGEALARFLEIGGARKPSRKTSPCSPASRIRSRRINAFPPFLKSRRRAAGLVWSRCWVRWT